MLSKNQLHEIQALHQQKQRNLRKAFIAEGVKTVLEIVQHRADILQAIYATAAFFAEHSAVLKGKQINCIEVNDIELQKISLQNSPNQVLAVCSFFEALGSTANSKVAFYLDDIRDPGNLGTIIRLSDWFGMTELYCSPNTCEHYNPKVIQSSMGSFLRVKLTYCELSDLQTQYPVRYAAVLNGANVFTEKLQAGLIIIGNEAKGISESARALTTHPIKIPAAKASNAESLNAAMAASILASEFFRQLH